MNKILWSLINTGKVVSFIDNVIIETEGEKGYNKVMKKVIKRITNHNLYVKPEKYK